MKVAIYKLGTGEIDRFVDAPPQMIEAQCKDGESFFLNCPEDATHIEGSDAVTIPPSSDQVYSSIRMCRNAMLASSDWTQLPDVPMETAARKGWAAYRQQLRDFPANCDPQNIVWPSAPII